MNDAPTPALEVLRDYANCVLHKDAAGFAGLYDVDVQVFDAWDSWRLQGRAAVQAMATAWFQSLGDSRVEVSFSDVQHHASAEVAALSATVIYTAVDRAGVVLRSQANRISLVLRCGPQGWRVVHEHTSVPVGFVSRQAIALPGG